MEKWQLQQQSTGSAEQNEASKKRKRITNGSTSHSRVASISSTVPGRKRQARLQTGGHIEAAITIGEDSDASDSIQFDLATKKTGRSTEPRRTASGSSDCAPGNWPGDAFLTNDPWPLAQTNVFGQVRLRVVEYGCEALFKDVDFWG